MFFITRKNSYAIQKKSRNQENQQEKFLTNRIKIIDLEIKATSKALFDAQLVKLRSLIGSRSSFLGSLQHKFIESNIEKSLNWHQSQLRELIQSRKALQKDLDKLTGKVWSKRLQKSLIFLLIGVTTLLSIFILLMGIFAAFYLLPFLCLIVLAFLTLKKLNIR